MIIECGSCNSRFRLDESRITGRGARVRCRKCGEPITVMKSDAAAPEAPGTAADGLDLRSIVREAMEAPEGEAPGLPEPQSEFERTSPDAGGKADAAPTAAGGGAPDDRGRAGESADIGPTVDFRIEEELSFAPARKETPAAERQAPPAPEGTARPQPPAETPASSEFVMSTADSLDFLKADYDQAEQKAALDISGNLRIAPAPGTDEGKVGGRPVSPPVPAPPPPAEPPQRPAGFRSEPAAQAGGAEAGAGRGLPGGAEAEAAAAAAAVKAASAPPRGTIAAPPSFPPQRPAAAPVRPPPAGRKPVGKRPALKRRQGSQLVRPSVVLLLLLFFAVAGGGAYLGFTSDGQRLLRELVPQIASFWPGAERTVSIYTVGNLIGYYESRGAAGRMFVIKGQITNEGVLRKTGVRVHAALLDVQNAKIAEKTVYAGNVFSDDVLRKATREKIEKALSNPIGGGLANMDIPPGKSIPFMVVFFDAPDGVDSYRLEPRDVD